MPRARSGSVLWEGAVVQSGVAPETATPPSHARLKLAEFGVEIVAREPVIVGRWLGFDPEVVAVAREQGNELDYARTIELMDWRTRVSPSLRDSRERQLTSKAPFGAFDQ